RNRPGAAPARSARAGARVDRRSFVTFRRLSRYNVGVLRLLVAVVAAGVLAPSALASEPLTDVNIRDVTLAVDATGQALVSYVREDGRPRHVLLWGAINALPPTTDVPQVRFKRDYAGGWRKYGDATYWKRFKNGCRPYDGPALPFLVAACKAPDGSYWAVQS